MFVNDTISSLAPLIRVNNRRFSEFTYLLSRFHNFFPVILSLFLPPAPPSLLSLFLLFINNMLSINKESRIISSFCPFEIQELIKKDLELSTTWYTLQTFSQTLKIQKGLKLIARHARHPFDVGYCFSKNVWKRTFLMVHTISVLLNILHERKKKKKETRAMNAITRDAPQFRPSNLPRDAPFGHELSSLSTYALSANFFLPF